MKKLSLAICCMFILSSLSFAGSPMGLQGYKDIETKEEKAARKAKMETMKKEFMEFQKTIEALIERFNSADGKDKSEIKNEIRALVAKETDKNIKMKREMFEDQKARISKMEEYISDLEANKDKRIDEAVEFITSAEGQAKMKEFKDKKGNMPPPPPPDGFHPDHDANKTKQHRNKAK